MTDTIRKRTVNRAAETRRKSAERQRRREAGEVRVEAWVSPRSADYLERLRVMTGRTTSEVIDYAIDAMGYANLKDGR